MLENYEQTTQRNTDYVESKLNFFEAMIERITYEQAQVSSLLGSKTLGTSFMNEEEKAAFTEKLNLSMLSVADIERN